MSIRTRRNSKRLLAGVLAGAFALSGVAVSSSVAADDVNAEDTFNPEALVIDGQDRYETAAIVAMLDDLFVGDVSTIILANGESFPDGLAASGVVGGLTGPGANTNAAVLLTRANSLPAATADALEEIGPGLVVALGGTAAISDAVLGQVAQALELDADEVDDVIVRIGGADRYETAAEMVFAWVALANANLARPIGNCVVLATGENFPDALAGGALAANGPAGQPCALLLTRGASLPASTEAALDLIADLVPVGGAAPVVYIAGGTSAVPASIATQLTTAGFTVNRLSGANRYETAQQIANVVNPNPEAYVLVSGENFPDALSAAPATIGTPGAADTGAPILLTQTAALTPSTRTWIGYNAGSVEDLFVVGGSAAVSNAAVNAALVAAAASFPAVTDAAALWNDGAFNEVTNPGGLRAARFIATSSANTPGVTFSAAPGLGLVANLWTISLVSSSATSVTINNADRAITVNIPAPTGTATASDIRNAWVSAASNPSRLFTVPTGALAAANVTVAAEAGAANAAINRGLRVSDNGGNPSTTTAQVVVGLSTKCTVEAANADFVANLSVTTSVLPPQATPNNPAVRGYCVDNLGGYTTAGWAGYVAFLQAGLADGGAGLPAATAVATAQSLAAALPNAPLIIGQVRGDVANPATAFLTSINYPTFRAIAGAILNPESGLGNQAITSRGLPWIPQSLLL